MALESSAFRSKFLDTDELLSYVSWFAVRNLSFSSPKVKPFFVHFLVWFHQVISFSFLTDV